MKRELSLAFGIFLGGLASVGGCSLLLQIFGIIDSFVFERGLFNDIVLVITASTMMGALAFGGPIILWDAIQKYPETPKTVCLCGSVCFKDDFELANEEFTLDGWIVVQPGVFKHADFHGGDLTHKKEMLDALHKEKILQSDLVFVINPEGYIGESTKSEIEFAEKNKIEIQYLEGDWL